MNLLQSPLHFGSVAVTAFFAVCFLQSAVDKFTDWKGNLDWLTGHFAKSPFAKAVPILLGLLACMEFASGGLCAAAVILSLAGKGGMLPSYALEATLTTLLALFSGQRIAKDYPGAVTIATYFAVALIGLLFAAGADSLQ